MILQKVLSILLVVGTGLAAPAVNTRGVAFNWGSEKIRGVNIGGWLVLEPWITPSLFEATGHDDIVDEYTMGEKLGPERALQLLRPHWDSFATWHDFNKIAQSGFNLVRIPIGFWAYDTFGTPYVSGAAPYLDAAIDWSRSLGLKVLIDLHGAPGSQNGFDNSGQRTPGPSWTTANTVQQTLQVLKAITDKYAQPGYHDVVVGIQVLNEPMVPRLDKGVVQQFYRDAFNQVRTVSKTPVIIHDGFIPPNNWNGFLTPSDNDAQNVAVDHHEYQVFRPDLVAMPPWQHRQLVCNNAESYNGADKWTFVGEWSGAMTDCAKYLNGRGVGARYDGSFGGDSFWVGDCGWVNDVNLWPESYKEDTRAFIEAQMAAFETKTQGWIWWNFKTEGASEWDAFRLIDAGIFPQPLTDRKFGAIC
ncbi:glycoside hydrolase family 5 protein, partial [Aaosphaeria arxii CBS 175.79]